MNYEKKIMTGFLAANILDLIVTLEAINQLNLTEVNPALQSLIVPERQTDFIIIKILIPVALICLFALSKEKNPRLEFTTKKTIEIGNVLVWTVVILNIITISGV